MRQADRASYEARDAEQRELAAAWLAEHPGEGSLPGQRDREGDEVGELKERAYPDLPFDDLHLILGQPLVARLRVVSDDERDLQERLDAVFERLLPGHQELIQEHYLERRTTAAMADSRSLTRQALEARLKTAVLEFTRLFGAHFAVGL